MGFQNNVKTHDSGHVSWRRISRLRSEIQHRIFLGVNFCSREFLGYWWKPWGYFWVLIFAPIWSSPSLEIQSPPARIHPLNNWARVWNLVKFKFFFNYLVWSSHCEYHNQFHFFSHGSSVWFKFIYSQPFRTQSWLLKINVHNLVMLWLLKSSSIKHGEKINANLAITHAKLIESTWSKISRWQ